MSPFRFRMAVRLARRVALQLGWRPVYVLRHWTKSVALRAEW